MVGWATPSRLHRNQVAMFSWTSSIFVTRELPSSLCGDRPSLRPNRSCGELDREDLKPDPLDERQQRAISRQRRLTFGVASLLVSAVQLSISLTSFLMPTVLI